MSKHVSKVLPVEADTRCATRFCAYLNLVASGLVCGLVDRVRDGHTPHINVALQSFDRL